MRIPRLFTSQALHVNDILCLEGDRAHYLRSVLRCRPGDTIQLFNGTGGAYEGTVQSIERHTVHVHLRTHLDENRESALQVKLGLAVSKRSAMDFTLQKCTELGVSEITPIITRFSDVAGKTAGTRHEHWLEVLRSACEQCERNRPPVLHEAMDLGDWVGNVEAVSKIVAHPGEHRRMQDLGGVTSPVALLVGPEGGLADAELATARSSGFEVVCLGPRILRVETAAVGLMAVVQSLWGDM